MWLRSKRNERTTMKMVSTWWSGLWQGRWRSGRAVGGGPSTPRLPDGPLLSPPAGKHKPTCTPHTPHTPHMQRGCTDVPCEERSEATATRSATAGESPEPLARPETRSNSASRSATVLGTASTLPPPPRQNATWATCDDRVPHLTACGDSREAKRRTASACSCARTPSTRCAQHV